MTWFTGLMVYLILWWMVFFAALPFGVRTPDASEIEKGHATSAPVRPRLWLKAGITTLVAAVLWVVAYWLITSDLLALSGS
jgi:predicted secreted protein